MEGLFIEIKKVSSEKSVGFIRLCQLKTLNSLTFSMIETLFETLSVWEKDPAICCIVIYSESEKFFCAGGDIKQLCSDQNVQRAKDFFSKEYAMDYFINHMRTPVLCWGSGYVMGGGAGIFLASSHPVVTDKTIFSMPETQIGFFTDVGFSYYFNQMGLNGWFLALTGAFVKGDELLSFKPLKCRGLVSDQKKEIFDGLLEINWSGESEKDKSFLTLFLNRFKKLPVLEMREAREEIKVLFEKKDISFFDHQFRKSKGVCEFVKKAFLKYVTGSPLSQKIIFELLRKNTQSSLEKCLETEWILATRMFEKSDLHKGVKALLVDKISPKWSHKDLKEVSEEEVQSFFHPIKPNAFSDQITKR